MALWDARKQDIETPDSAPGLCAALDRIDPVGHERCGWRVTWLAAGLEGLDDEHAAAAARARVRERLCLIANACFHTAKARSGHGVGRILADWTFWNIPPRDGFRPVTRPSAPQSR